MTTSYHHKESLETGTFKAVQAEKSEVIQTPIGNVAVNKGDWIVEHPNGGRMVYIDAVFRATFASGTAETAAKKPEAKAEPRPEQK